MDRSAFRDAAMMRRRTPVSIRNVVLWSGNRAWRAPNNPTVLLEMPLRAGVDNFRHLGSWSYEVAEEGFDLVAGRLAALGTAFGSAAHGGGDGRFHPRFLRRPGR